MAVLHCLFSLILALTLPCLATAAICTSTGPQCTADCKGIVLCPGIGLQDIEITTCHDNTFCSENNGTVACDAFYCGEAIFICTAPGGVPNPLDCTSYYLCPGVNVNGILQSCPTDSVFDVATLSCSNSSDCIPSPVCSDPAEQGNYDDSGKFCYICDDRRLPIIYPCMLGTLEAEDEVMPFD